MQNPVSQGIGLFVALVTNLPVQHVLPEESRQSSGW
jgi:hypothetical protein